MKKQLLLAWLVCAMSCSTLHAQVLTGSSVYTNDQEHLSFWQTLSSGCPGSGYTVPSLHGSTQIFTNSSYTFQPGYTYTVQINGYATASGNLLFPVPSPIYWGVSTGPLATSTSNVSAICGPYPSGAAYSSYIGLISVTGPDINPRATSTIDFLTPFISNTAAIGSFPISTTVSTSTSASFTVPYAETGYNIEVFPLAGQRPSQLYTENGCGGYSNPPVATTTTTLSMTTITITKSGITYPYPTINGNTSFNFSGSVKSGSGTITANPGSTVTVIVNAGGPPPGPYTTSFYLSGASFNSNTSGSSPTTLTASSGSNTATFIMPVNGSVSWSGTFNEGTSDGSGAITVR
jgi:hypothetical protein